MKWVLLLFSFYKPYKTTHIVVKKCTQGRAFSLWGAETQAYG